MSGRDQPERGARPVWPLALLAGLFGTAAILLVAVASPAVAAEGASPRSPGQLFDIQLLWLRLGIAAVAALLLCGLAWSSRSPRRNAFARARSAALALLGVLATAAFCANYNFFLWPRLHGIHAHDVFHYYVGAKYFPELGYFDLYRCSLSVAGQQTEGATAAATAVRPGTPVRNLRTLRMETAGQLEPAAARCDGLFSPERWRAFEHDVKWFQSRLRARKWKVVLTDHGFNPSPVWLLLGGSLANWIPAEGLAMRLAVRIDLILLLGAFATVAWAFGFRVLCTVVIAWGANPLSRYQWIGDAFLRYPWLVAGIMGICFLKLRRGALGGGLLALAALLRVFPAFQLLCLAVYGLREGWARRGLAKDFVRVSVAVAVVASALLVAGAARNGRGVLAYREFAENIVPHSEVLAWSSVGLRPLLAFSSETGGLRDFTSHEQGIQQAKVELVESRRVLYWGVLGLFFVLLFRVLGRCQAWEAAALGVVPALLLTSMLSYYVAMVVSLGLLAVSRPRIGIALMLALVCWCASALAFYSDRLDFVVSSAVALALMLYTLIEMQWRTDPAVTRPGSRAGQR